jgi:protein-S-isoprenylcysteine O-methyltransferase Ste14
VIGHTTAVLVLAAWFAFAAIFVLRRKPAGVTEAKRATVARFGIMLQGIGFGIVWGFRRPLRWPMSPSVIGELALGALAVVLAWASCWWCLRSVQTLGKQWTVQARLIHEHELITTGPFGIVRNPIYLGMFGLLLATGLTFSRWWAVLCAVIVFLVGNQIRIRAEERLLREAFGSKFDDYARRVPAFLPRRIP